MAQASVLTGATAGAPSSLARARLELSAPRPAGGGGAVPGATLDRIDFQFNPRELTITKTAKWKSESARNSGSAPPPEFQGAEPSKLALEMFFDASEKQDNSVVDAVEALFQCCVPTSDSAQKKKAVPPLVIFAWGSIKSFPSYITSVSAKYSLFTAGGVPIRATCTVTLQEMAGGSARQNPTSGGIAVQQARTLVEGETLASVAFREYGDPTVWRALARANGIDDPLRLRPGDTVLVPAVEELPSLL